MAALVDDTHGAHRGPVGGQEEIMSYDDGYALLIGIDDYGAFDRETGQPEGTSDLRGSVYDARVLFRVCVALGMKPANIRVLVSSRPDPAHDPEVAAVAVGDATEQGIRDGIGWLRDRLAAGSPGLLAYSGHGAHLKDEGLLLCPSDTGKELRHAISFDEVSELLGDATCNLTVLLGCCHGVATKSAPSGARRRPAVTLGGAPIEPRDLGRCEATLKRMGARVLAACQPGEMTQQASIAGRWRGAFVWALSATVDQWAGVDDPGTRTGRLDLSYGTLMEKARRLLDTLEFEGTPTLYGPPGVGELSVFQVGNRPKPTSPSPTAERHCSQLDGGMNNTNRLYTLTARDGRDDATVIATIFVTSPDFVPTRSPAGQDLGPSTEYYFCHAALPRDVRSITVEAVDGRSPPSGRYIYYWRKDARFQPMTPEKSANTFVHEGSPNFALHWDVTWDGKTWVGTITWFNTANRELFSDDPRVDYIALNDTTSTRPTWWGCRATFGDPPT